MWYISCVSPLDKVEKALRFVCLHWSTAGSSEKVRDVREEGKDIESMAACEWSGAVSFQSNPGTLHVFRNYTVVRSCTAEMPCYCWKAESRRRRNKERLGK